MNVLLIKPEPYEEPEIREYLQALDCDVYIARGQTDVCRVLSERVIDSIFINLINLEDFSLIRYINENYPKANVVVISEAGVGKAIDNVRRCAFEAIRRPFHLNQFDEVVKTVSKLNKKNG